MNTSFIDGFRDMMELKFAENYDEKGDSWRDCDMEFLWNKMFEEMIEVTDHHAMDGYGQSELVDLALVAAMLWTREKNRMVEEKADNLPDNFLDGLYGRR